MGPAETRLLSVEVIYSPSAGEFDSVQLSLLPGACVRDAVRMSGMLARHGEIDLERQKVGVWGKWRGLDEGLRDRDRVEIYRPLTLDPKEARRRRQRVQGAAGGLTGGVTDGLTDGVTDTRSK